MSGYFLLSDGRTVSLKDGFVIGRGARCDLALDDGKASRRHARVIVEGGVVEIEDLDSSNGTLLNGKPVTRRMLRAGDQVRIGKSVLVFHEGEPAGSSESSAPGGGAVSGGGGAPMFDDDDELFGGSAPAASAPAPAPRPVPTPVPDPDPGPTPNLPRPEPEPQPKPTPAPTPAPANVVEFADEVIEVRTPAPEPAPPATAVPGASASDPVAAQQSKVLQFSKNAASSNVLGDDVSQMSAGMRALVFLAVLAGMVGLAWLVMNLVR